MRCFQVRQKIASWSGLIPLGAEGAAVGQHLDSCRECALYAQAEKLLQTDIKSAMADDNIEIVPLAQLRNRIEADTSRPANMERLSFMRKLQDRMLRRPRTGIVVGAIMAVVILVTLIPFKLDQTIGYEVAIAGVDPNLALDEEKVNALLIALGVDGATFNVETCDPTCLVKITELKSPKDVMIITEAFNEMGNCVIDTIISITELESASLLSHISGDIRFTFVSKGDDEIHEFVLGRLNSISEDTCNIFTVWTSEGDNEFVFEGMPDSCVFITCEPGGESSINITGADPLCQILEIFSTENSGDHFVANGIDGNIIKLDLDDPDLEQKLKELGITTSFTKGGNGAFITSFKCEKDGALVELIGEEQSEAHKEAATNTLPEGFSLSQNFPNPFNPTTSFRFSIAQSEHVTIDIINVSGQTVRTLVDEGFSAGEHEIMWDATDNNGQKVASGVYIYRMSAGDVMATKKMTLLK